MTRCASDRSTPPTPERPAPDLLLTAVLAVFAVSAVPALLSGGWSSVRGAACVLLAAALWAYLRRAQLADRRRPRSGTEDSA